MHAAIHEARPPLWRAAAGLCLVALGWPALAAEDSASAPAATAKVQPNPDARDPLDAVRERLAARLGAIKAPGGRDADAVRVVAKARAAGSESSSSTAPADASRRMRHSPRLGVSPREAQVARDTSHPWSYASGDAGGPETWGRMNPAFATCSSGTRQSPIDIRDGIKVELDAVQFDYRPSAFRVIDNGHTVQVNLAPGNSIEVLGQRYELVQFQFHRPSEERIDGKQFDMAVHLIHKNADGHLAVVAVLLDRGSAQPVVQAVWNNLPLEQGVEVAARLPLDPGALLPEVRSYFTYMGSLTAPPCGEGVLWLVMKQPVPISPQQIDIFTRLYPMNARPVQSAGGRLIKESN